MQKFNIMISSRCKTKIKDGKQKVELSEVRNEIKSTLQSAEILGKNIFQVWISEDPQDQSAEESSWDACMSQVNKSDLIICIYTGEGGWAKGDGDIGICHAELETGFNMSPAKVRIIKADSAAVVSAHTKRDEAFQNYVRRINRFHTTAKDKAEIVSAAQAIAVEALAAMAKLGKRETNRGKFNYGDALSWSRMNFVERSKEIVLRIQESLIESGAKAVDGGVLLEAERLRHLVIIHGCPSGMNVSAAREMVGQPFLRDHEYIKSNPKNCCGPIHLIGVHKGVTEQQAISMLGHPDAVVVDGSFGIYVADKIQNIQMILLSNCRDASSSVHNAQRLLSWLEDSGESSDFFNRSRKRREIIKAIIQQQNS